MKKHRKKIYLLAMLVMIVFIASGCVRYTSTGEPTGWVYQYLGQPTSHFLNWLASSFGGSYGIAIIIVTILTRLFMMPSTIKMQRDSMKMQAKMRIAQPEIDEIQEDLKLASDPQEQADLNKELMEVYKKYDINMLSSFGGCLPLLIQMPIISAVYVSIRTSAEIKNSAFMGISLGENSLSLTIAVIVIYFIQGWLAAQSTAQTNPQAAQQTKSMMFMNPILIGWISYTGSAGIGLYFLAGGIFQIGQQLFTNLVIRPKIEEEMEKEEQKVVAKPRRKRKTIKTVSNPEQIVPTKQTVQKNKRRNEGKQNRRK